MCLCLYVSLFLKVILKINEKACQYLALHNTHSFLMISLIPTSNVLPYCLIRNSQNIFTLRTWKRFMESSMSSILRLLNGLLIQKDDSHPVPVILLVKIHSLLYEEIFSNKASLPERLSMWHSSASASGSYWDQWLLRGRRGKKREDKPWKLQNSGTRPPGSWALQRAVNLKA